MHETSLQLSRLPSSAGFQPKFEAASVDEKSQVQALERTQPLLPIGLGYVEGVTHDYYRHDTTTLFAALNLLDGSAISQCKPRHRHQEFLAFLNHLDHNVPEDLEVHLIADNYATHKHPRVKAWLAHRPRYPMHYAPTYASWLNQVERWCALITQQAIRRGSFRSVRELVHQIDQYVTHHNARSRPFVWTANADSIFEKLQRHAQSDAFLTASWQRNADFDLWRKHAKFRSEWNRNVFSNPSRDHRNRAFR
jgi:putative transposase